ncbi:MAG TPA: nitrate ABC transporter ATP-binding protein [Flavobacteriaceae bacterium]|jgi:NitT/TauT family transport system ATP-binding protein|nr:nitrate ABC transporter ATP-binding protein [Flavobacteriaceae bacterium]HBS12918.1 nitrate ABC transporter ATP-binding protein [Flavobacteriaceae bacterium]
MEKLIEFKNINKTFDTLEVIKNLSFEVNSTDIIGILGASGVGKSTILKLIAGLDKPTKGTLINNTKKVGYVFQEPRLLPWKTALQNVLLPLLISGKQKNKAKKKALYYLDKMGLNGFENYYPSQLSGGMLQRVSLARAFALEPDLLLLDEPFSSLDIRLKSVLETMLKELLTEHPIPVLYVSHSPEEVVQFANRIFMMFAGGVIEELPVDEDEDFKEFLKDAFLMTL